MNEVTAFEVGQMYTNDQIRFSLQLKNLGGIRPALDGQGKVRHVAVLTCFSTLSAQTSTSSWGRAKLSTTGCPLLTKPRIAKRIIKLKTWPFT
jgi:hypothetical protein